MALAFLKKGGEGQLQVMFACSITVRYLDTYSTQALKGKIRHNVIWGGGTFERKGKGGEKAPPPSPPHIMATLSYRCNDQDVILRPNWHGSTVGPIKFSTFRKYDQSFMHIGAHQNFNRATNIHRHRHTKQHFHVH